MNPAIPHISELNRYPADFLHRMLGRLERERRTIWRGAKACQLCFKQVPYRVDILRKRAVRSPRAPGAQQNARIRSDQNVHVPEPLLAIVHLAERLIPELGSDFSKPKVEIRLPQRRPTFVGRGSVLESVLKLAKLNMGVDSVLKPAFGEQPAGYVKFCVLQPPNAEPNNRTKYSDHDEFLLVICQDERENGEAGS